MGTENIINSDSIRDNFIYYVRGLVEYWKKSDLTNDDEKLEKLAFSILVALDGEAVGVPGFHIIPLTDEESSFDYDIAGNLHDLFYTLPIKVPGNE